MTIFPKISAVILSYRRPENCQKIISMYESYEIISDIVLISNDGYIPKHNPNKTNVVVSNNTRGIYERYYGGLMAKTDWIFMSDDDFILPEKSIEKMVGHFKNDNEIIHGFFGRKPNKFGLYAKYIDNIESDTEIVLVGLSFFHKKFIQLFINEFKSTVFKIVFLVNRLFGVHRSNGEDILFAYLSSSYSGKKHKVHNLDVIFLPEGEHAISKRRHIRFLICRTIIMWIGKIFFNRTLLATYKRSSKQ